MAKTGIDIAAISRFKRFTGNQSDPFLAKNFSALELAYCFSYANPAQHLAGTFAAKEAVNKAFGGTYALSEIEIRRTKKGAPTAWRNNRKLTLSISIAHEENMAIAVAVG